MSWFKKGSKNEAKKVVVEAKVLVRSYSGFMPKFGVYNGKRFTLKKNGLPEGYGLYLRETDGKEYIFTKFHGRGLSCHTSDWKRAVEFVDELRKKYDEESKYNPNLLVSDLLDVYVKYLDAKNAARGDYKPSTAKNTKYVIEKNVKPFFGKYKATQITNLPDKEIEYRTKRTRELTQKRRKPTDQVQHTIDKELRIVLTAFNLAAKKRKISKAIVPMFEIDKANTRKNVRTGVVSEDQFDILMEKLPDFLLAPFALVPNDRGAQKGMHLHSPR